MLIAMSLYIILLVVKQVNAVVVVTTSMIYMQNVCSWCCKKLNVKVFNPMSRTNETRHIERHETCNVD